VTSDPQDRPFDGPANSHDDQAHPSGDSESRETDRRKTWITPRVLRSDVEHQTNKTPFPTEYDTFGLGPSS
jgi:hypothetical protein